MCNQNFNWIPAIANLDYNPATKKHDPLLSLARASLLAGMPQNPVSYDPTLGPDNVNLALARQDYVLQQMLSLNMHVNSALGDQTNDYGPITPDMIQQVEAMTAKMTFAGFHSIQNAPHFVEWVRSQLEIALGNGNKGLEVHLFLTGAFNIPPTIDYDLEKYVENAVQRHLDQPELQYFLATYPYGPLNTKHNVNDSAVVVMNAKDGEILAMDGSANYKSKEQTVAGNFNAATSPRPPGSAFKPIVYATAFQMGWYPGIVLPDKQTFFPAGSQSQDVHLPTATYHPSDYGGTATRGYWHNINSSILLGIANSFNVPAIKALEFAGLQNVLNMARRFGITDLDTDAVNYVNAYNKK